MRVARAAAERWRAAAPAASCWLCLTGNVAAQEAFSSVYVFGDSLSDAGRVPALIEAQDPDFPLIFPVSPPYFAGRFSNGPVYSELLSGLIGAPPAPERNFAVGGAKIGDDNISDLLLQVFSDGRVELPGIGEQIGEFVGAGGIFDAGSVVVLYGGSGDYLSFPEANEDPSGTEIAAFVDATVARLEVNIRELAAAGATTILLPNIVDLGATPLYLGTDQQATQTAFAELHDAAMNARLGELGEELGVQLFVADFASGFELIRAEPELFGFADVTTPCVLSAGPLPPYVTPGTVCSPEEAAASLFFDNVHPTAAGHQLLAQYAADTLLAPAAVAAQAELGLLAGQSFLGHMRSAAQGGSALTMRPARDAALAPYRVFASVELAGGERDFAGALGFDYGLTSFAAGVTFDPWEALSLGLVAGYDSGEADLAGSAGQVELRTPRLGLIGTYDRGPVFASAGFAFGFDEYDVARQTAVPELTASADPGGRSLGAFFSAGYRVGLGAAHVGPVLDLRYSHVTVEDYAEEGAPGLDMLVEEERRDELVGAVGLAAAARIERQAVVLSPHAEIFLEGVLSSDDVAMTTALLTVPDVPRELEAEPLDGPYARLAGGLDLAFGTGVTLNLQGEATVGRDGGDDYAGFGRVAVAF